MNIHTYDPATMTSLFIQYYFLLYFHFSIVVTLWLLFFLFSSSMTVTSFLSFSFTHRSCCFVLRLVCLSNFIYYLFIYRFCCFLSPLSSFPLHTSSSPYLDLPVNPHVSPYFIHFLCILSFILCYYYSNLLFRMLIIPSPPGVHMLPYFIHFLHISIVPLSSYYSYLLFTR